MGANRRGAALGFVIVAALSMACAEDPPPPPRPPKPPRETREEVRHRLFMDAVWARAAFDLSCPQPEVRLVELGDAALGALGCGRRVGYSCLCTRHVFFTCSEVVCAPDGGALRAPPEPQQPPPPPLPPAPPAAKPPA